MKVVNENGDAFNVKLVRAGERYGRTGALVAEQNMIEFYDATYAGKRGYDVEGHFASRYDVETLAEDAVDLRLRGLDLHGGVPKWKVSGANMTAIFDWLLLALDCARMRVTETQKRSIPCPECGAKARRACRSSRQPGPNTLGGGWGGPPDLERAHDRRRHAYLVIVKRETP